MRVFSTLLWTIFGFGFVRVGDSKRGSSGGRGGSSSSGGRRASSSSIGRSSSSSSSFGRSGSGSSLSRSNSNTGFGSSGIRQINSGSSSSNSRTRTGLGTAIGAGAVGLGAGALGAGAVSGLRNNFGANNNFGNNQWNSWNGVSSGQWSSWSASSNQADLNNQWSAWSGTEQNQNFGNNGQMGSQNGNNLNGAWSAWNSGTPNANSQSNQNSWSSWNAEQPAYNSRPQNNAQKNKQITALLLSSYIGGRAVKKIAEYNTKSYLTKYRRNYWIGTRYYYRDPESDQSSREACFYSLTAEDPQMFYEDNTQVRQIVFQCKKYFETCCGMDCCKTAAMNASNSRLYSSTISLSTFLLFMLILVYIQYIDTGRNK